MNCLRIRSYYHSSRQGWRQRPRLSPLVSPSLRSEHSYALRVTYSPLPNGSYRKTFALLLHKRSVGRPDSYSLVRRRRS